MSLTIEQVRTVRSTVPALQAHGDEITALFYKTLLEEYPELHNVFNQTNQISGAQPKALASALFAYATHIDDLGALSPAVERICQKHASLYIQPAQYELVGKYLLQAFGEVLGAALTKEVFDAWYAAYWQLANIMIGREQQLYKSNEGWLDWRDFRIAEKVQESDEITSFYLKPVDGLELPRYLPGQYISIQTNVPELHSLQSRQYSLSDAPNSDYYRISVKRELGRSLPEPNAGAHPGFISNIMHDAKEAGDVIQVSCPAGEFFLDERSEEQSPPCVLLSAGVGITPMIAMLNTLVKSQSTSRISFIHGARSSSVQAFGVHVSDLVDKFEHITAAVFIKTPVLDNAAPVKYIHEGRVRLDVLDRTRDLLLADKRTLYFICGPAVFMDDMADALRDLGVEDERLRMEVFGLA